MKKLEGEHGVSALSKALGVSRSGYYQWRASQLSNRARSNQVLDEKIREVFAENLGRYGSPRVWRSLKVKGIGCGRHRVCARMKELGLKARRRKRYVPSTTDSRHSGPIAPNLLLDSAEPTAARQVWLTDITYLLTNEGWLYLAAVLDAHTREIVGWATRESLEADLVCAALRQAWERYRPEPGLIIHSDRGSQYASQSYRALIDEMKAIRSMSRKANCYDNAQMESVWSTIKTEEFSGPPPHSHQEAHSRVFRYIEIYYNRRRIHSSLDYKSPVDFAKNLN